jgi:hypothetical protein
MSEDRIKNGVGKAACRLRARVDLPELEAPLRRMMRPGSDIFRLLKKAADHRLDQTLIEVIIQVSGGSFNAYLKA